MNRTVRHPPLNSLKIFSVVADHESISKASKELCITEGAISKQIKNIEHTLELSLFIRKNRRLYLTDEGHVLHQCCKKILLELADTLEKLTLKPVDEPLTISCEPTLTMRWLIPNLPKFQQAHPNIPIRIFAAGGPIDLRISKVDLAIRRNDFVWDSEYCSEKIADEIIGPVCSIEYWKAHKEHQTPPQVLHTKTRFEAWEKWLENSDSSITMASEMVFEHFYLSIQAAASGLGMAIGSLYMCQEELSSERLVAPFGFLHDGSAYHLLSETPINDDERKETFLNWIRQEFSSLENASLANIEIQ